MVVTPDSGIDDRNLDVYTKGSDAGALSSASLSTQKAATS
jgi:hypothetical protein